ncbi:MAG: LCP family protein [Oscillospiraceae bacterium]|nr:LCP family protein [Oscillospiraceae bacterium]
MRAGKLKSFTLSFFLTFFVMSSVSAVSIAWLSIDSSVKNAAADNNYTAPYMPKDTESLSILIAGCSLRVLPAERFTLIKYDPVSEHIAVMGIPGEMSATVGTRTSTLTDMYDYGGIGMAKTAVENTFGIRINRTARIETAGIINIVDHFGGILYDLKNQIRYDHAATGIHVSLEPGRQILDGRRTAAFLHHVPDDDRIHAVNQKAEFTAEFIRQIISVISNNNYESTFNMILKNHDGNMGIYDFMMRRAGLFYLAENKKLEITAVKISGKYNSLGEFLIDISNLPQMAIMFK